jgi:hypothetical protein
VADNRPVDGRRARRRGPDPARRRHADQLRQLSRLRLAQPLRRSRELRLLPIKERVRLGHAARARGRPQRRPGRYDLVGPKTGQERESALTLASGQTGSLLFADGGFWGRELHSSLELIDVELITPTKHKPGQRPASEVAKARIRLVIESVFSNLKIQMRLERHLVKTVAGLVQRIAQRLLALTLSVFLNVLTGRPPRALAAYDGR